MTDTVPISSEGKPFNFKFNPFASDHLDFTANHPDASESQRELGATGLVVLPELARLLVEIRAIYSGIQVHNKPCHTLCLAGLALP
jgi:hypothetical protein